MPPFPYRGIHERRYPAGGEGKEGEERDRERERKREGIKGWDGQEVRAECIALCNECDRVLRFHLVLPLDVHPLSARMVRARTRAHTRASTCAVP